MSCPVIPFPIADGFVALERRISRWRAEIGAPGWVDTVWPDLLGTLRLLRAQVSDPEWTALRGALRGSEIAALALEDPLTRWSWERPRGLPACAGMLDMAYGHSSQRTRIAAATALGRDVHGAVYVAPSLLAVRERLGVFRRMVAKTVANVADASVLSIGAGHLRAAEQLGGKSPSRWVALEADPLAIPELARHAGVEPTHTSLAQFMARPRRLGSFDLVCCAGLYDRLDAPTARRLTAAGFAALRPGGRLVVANFAAEQADAGYLDVFMDWRPGWRNEADMAALSANLPGAAPIRHFRQDGAVIYTVVGKPANPLRRAA